MRSRCSQSQEGAYPAFLHQSNFGSLTSPLDNVTPAPMVHAANGIQNNMVATQYPAELKVASAQLSGSTMMHNRDNVSSTTTGTHRQFQYSKPQDTVCTPHNSCHQIREKANEDLHSSAHVSAQHSRYFGTSATENSARQSVHNGGKQEERECSKQNFNQHFPKGTIMNNHSRLQQRQHLNCAPSTGTSSAAPLGDALGIAAQTFPNERNANIELSSNFSDGRHCKSQQVRTSLVALNCGQIRTQDMDHSVGTHFVPHQQDVSSISLSDLPSTDQALPAGETEPLTDDQILNFIADKLACFQNEANAELTKSKETVDCTTSSPEKHSTEYPQIMMNVAAACTKNEDESPVVLTAVPEMTLDELTEKHPSITLNCSSSQEYKRPRLNISENLDDKDQVSGDSSALKHMTEKEKVDIGLKPVETVGLDKVRGVTQTKPSSVVSENKQDTLYANTKKKKNMEDQHHCSVFSMAVIAHSKQTSSIDELKVLIHNEVVTNQSEWLCNQTSVEGVRADEGSVHSQTDSSTALSENKVIEQAPLFESKEGLTFPAGQQDPQYEDISEDENPQTENMSVERPSLTQIPECNNKQSPFGNKGNGLVRGQAHMKTELISDETPTPRKQVSPKTESFDISQHCCGPCFPETDDIESPKCDRKTHLECQTKHSVLCSSSTILKDKDETDDKLDDDWIVIPINMLDLKFEPEDEDQDGPEKVVLDDGETGDKTRPCGRSPTYYDFHSPAPKPIRAPASSQMEVFDTIQSFLQAKTVQFNTFEVAPGRSTPDCEMASEGESYALQNRQESYSDPEDSCETEDSCDYSSGSEHNYLTVSRHLFKNRSAHQPPETVDSVSETEGKDDEVTNVQKGQTRSLDKLGSMQELRHLIEAGPKQLPKTPKEDYIIILSSDEEEENDQNCKKTAKRNDRTEDSGDAPHSLQKKHSPETMDSRCGAFKEEFKKNRLLSADSPAPQRQSILHHTQVKEVMQIAHSDQSHSTEKCGQQIEIKAGFENVQHNELKNSKENVIIIDSDTEDDNDQNYKKANGGRSSGSVDDGNVICFQQKRHSSETADSEYGTATEILQETRQPIEPKGGSEHVQHKTNQQMTSKRRNVFDDSDKVVKKDNFSKMKVNTKNLLSSRSGDSGGALFAAQNRPSTETGYRLSATANEKPEENGLSRNDSPEKQPQCVDEEVNFTLGPSPFIPRLVVLQSFQPNDHLKLIKEPGGVHRQGKDDPGSPKTPIATKKKTDSYENNMRHLHRNKKGRFVSKQTTSVDRPAAQANVTKLRLVSRQLSLPSQERPSTSTGSLSSTRAQLSEAKQSSSSSTGWFSQSGETSASSSLPKSKQSTSAPRQRVSSFTLQQPHSYSNTSTKDPSPSVDIPSAKKQLIKDWQKTFFPVQRYRKPSPGMEEDLRTTNHNLCTEARPGRSNYDRTPRQRHNSHEPTAPLMKKTKIDAIQWTKAINRDAPREQRYSVGEGYKWSEKPTVPKPTKGSSRQGKKCRSPRRRHR